MLDQRAATGVDLRDSDVAALGKSLRGTVLRPGEVAFESARQVWNTMIDRTPALIVRCAGVADVRAALELARSSGLPLAIRSGGHNVAGSAICDGGIVIDLSLMKGMHVDPRARRARAEAGLLWGEFDRETAVFGLATTGGLISTTGIAGLTLGGGLGWLMRRYGLTCDNLLSVDLVLADGRVVSASAEENPELFWGVRGGGGNFGIVTHFAYQLYPLTTVLAGLVVHPIQHARELLRFYREYAQDIPDELTAHAGLLVLPDVGAVAAILVCHCGPPEQAEHDLAPLRAFGTPLQDAIAPMPYTALQRMYDAGSPPGLRNYWKSSFLPTLDDAAIDTLVEGFAAAPSARSNILIERLGGAVGRVPEEATAFSERHAAFDLLISAVWEGADDDAANIAWARTLFAAMAPFQQGVAYVNYLGDDDAGRVRAAYGAQKYDRLVALKNAYDPTNLFRFNQNIAPTVSRPNAPDS